MKIHKKTFYVVGYLIAQLFLMHANMQASEIETIANLLAQHSKFPALTIQGSVKDVMSDPAGGPNREAPECSNFTLDISGGQLSMWKVVFQPLYKTKIQSAVSYEPIKLEMIYDGSKITEKETRTFNVPPDKNGLKIEPFSEIECYIWGDGHVPSYPVRNLGPKLFLNSWKVLNEKTFTELLTDRNAEIKILKNIGLPDRKDLSGLEQIVIKSPEVNLKHTFYISPKLGGLIIMARKDFLDSNYNETGSYDLFEVEDLSSSIKLYDGKSIPFPKTLITQTVRNKVLVYKSITKIDSVTVRNDFDKDYFVMQVEPGTLVKDKRLGVAFEVGKNAENTFMDFKKLKLDFDEHGSKK